MKAIKVKERELEGQIEILGIVKMCLNGKFLKIEYMVVK